MSKFDEKMEKYTASIDKHFAGHQTDEDLLRKVAKGLGPSIYSNDAGQVSCSDKKELATIKERFLMKKHGLADGDNLDTAIQEVCEQYKAARPKHRAVFYYILTKKLGLEKNYA